MHTSRAFLPISSSSTTRAFDLSTIILLMAVHFSLHLDSWFSAPLFPLTTGQFGPTPHGIDLPGRSTSVSALGDTCSCAWVRRLGTIATASRLLWKALPQRALHLLIRRLWGY